MILASELTHFLLLRSISVTHPTIYAAASHGPIAARISFVESSCGREAIMSIEPRNRLLPDWFSRLALHDKELFARHSVRLGMASSTGNKLTVGCAGQKGLGVAYGELVRHHQVLSYL